MTDQIVDTLKQPESAQPDLNSFDDEQLDAVIIYLAKLVRNRDATDEQRKKDLAHFLKLYNSWPAEFSDRVNARICETFEAKNLFWAKPADAIIAATKAVELA